jgi:hypothetical protein
MENPLIPLRNNRKKGRMLQFPSFSSDSNEEIILGTFLSHSGCDSWGGHIWDSQEIIRSVSGKLFQIILEEPRVLS